MTNRKNGIRNGASVIITGASTGIGRALAVSLAQRYKAKLALNARSESTLQEAKTQIEKAGGQAIVVPGDIGNEGVQKELVERTLQEFGAVDVLVNNAGFGRPGPMLALTPKDWEEVFAVNFFAAVKLTYLVLPQYIKQQSGTIVNISSLAGKVAIPGSVCYSSSKFALTAFSEGMAGEFATRNINVVTVCPGLVRTEFFEKNKMAAASNPTLIAEKNNFTGLVMRHLLSISTEDAVRDIVSAMEKGQSQEIMLTYPAIVIERLAGVCPPIVSKLLERRSMLRDQIKKTASTTV
jgi:3-oxoacyl-[acyl-carrier protein] reductase